MYVPTARRLWRCAGIALQMEGGGDEMEREIHIMLRSASSCPRGERKHMEETNLWNECHVHGINHRDASSLGAS
eukprot:65359-Pyramimonas_sp.AAC.1